MKKIYPVFLTALLLLVASCSGMQFPSPDQQSQIEPLQKWLIENAPWVFQGIGLYFIGGLIWLIGGLIWLVRRRWSGRSQRKASTQQKLNEQIVAARRKNRAGMLAVMRQRVKEEREQALVWEVLIELGLQTTPDAVAYSHSALAKDDGSRNIAAAYDQALNSLLILGEPGSGKTTLLYELTGELIRRAEQDADAPIPIIFNLASWSESQNSLDQWLLEELQHYYPQVSKKVAQDWIEQESLALMLDGLDEVSADYREECVTAINAFQDARNLVSAPLVVCCRKSEYEAINIQLNVREAVTAQPLSDDDIKGYFRRLRTAENHTCLAAIQSVLQQDEELLAESRYPLMLNVILLTFFDRTEQMVTLMNRCTLKVRPLIFDAYIQRMFEHRIREHTTSTMKPPTYTPHETISWLSWLAAKMVDRNQMLFVLNRIQADLLGSARNMKYYRAWCMVYLGLVSGLTYALVVGLTMWTVLGTVADLVYGLAGGLFMGLLMGLVVKLETGLPEILSIEQLSVSIKSVVKTGWKRLSVGLILGLVIGLVVGFIPALVVVLGFATWEILNQSHTIVVTEVQQLPKFSSRQTFQYAIGNVLVLSGVLGLTFGLGIALEYGTSIGLVVGLTVWLLFGLNFGAPCIQHYALRVLLVLERRMPLNYPEFLEYARDRLFLRREGYAYRFTHRMLMEHFAAKWDR